jgi:multidrug efflux pump subunit AcrA (membrane-fusion protein)
MTANMSIVTNEIPNVLVLPSRVVQKDDKGSFVSFVTFEKGKKIKTERRNITVGAKGDGDVVEISSGLSEGEKVLWTPKLK